MSTVTPQQDPSQGRPRLLTVEDAAERLGTTVHFTRQLIKEKRISYVKFGGARRSPVRIREDVLEAFVRDHTVDATE